MSKKKKDPLFITLSGWCPVPWTEYQNMMGTIQSEYDMTEDDVYSILKCAVDLRLDLDVKDLTEKRCSKWKKDILKNCGWKLSDYILNYIVNKLEVHYQINEFSRK